MLLARAASGSGSVATFVTGCGEMVMLPDLEKLLPLTPMDVACSVMLPVSESPEEELESSTIPQAALRLELPVNEKLPEPLGSNAYMQAGPATAPLTARAPTFMDL